MEIILFLVLLVVPLDAFALDPGALMNEIRQTGARETLTSLWSEKRYMTDWFAILEGVKTGSDGWLAVAAALKPAADAGMSTDLNAALAAALPKKAAEVLVIVAKEKKTGFHVSKVCTNPFIEETDERVLTFLQQTEKAVAIASVSKEVEQTRAACLRKLKAVRKDVATRRKVTNRGSGRSK